ncbi:MAG: low temperature requirement protein A, partial [Halobacteriales archaeon]|nr:low temperature requirement protein A [Halobacteriales archaeon]
MVAAIGNLTRRWWRPPSVYSDVEHGIRHATWLELFFDLVFVVAMAELGAYLHEHLTPVGFLEFAGLFAIVWWIWLGIAYFADTYNTDDPMSAGLIVVAMFGVIFLSQSIEGALRGSSFTFAVAVLVLRGFLSVSHLRARHLRESLPTGEQRFLTAWIWLEVVVTVVWGLSLLVPEPGRFGLWIASFVLGVSGLTVIYLTFETILAPKASHCNERLGLLTILVLGETILAVSFGVSIVAFTPAVLLVSGLGFAIAVSLWWLYFNRYDERVYERTVLARTEHWARRRPRGIAHVYAHVLVHAGIVAAGVGIAVTLEAAFSNHALGVGG